MKQSQKRGRLFLVYSRNNWHSRKFVVDLPQVGAHELGEHTGVGQKCNRLLIKGDSCAVLKLLLKDYLGKTAKSH